MEGRVKIDLMYCEIFSDHHADPEDIALHEGDVIEVLRDFTEYDESTFLALIPDGDVYSYATIPMDAIDLEVNNDNP